jgi:hypothetical protein
MYKHFPAQIRYDIGHVAVNPLRFGLPFGAEKCFLEPVNGIKIPVVVNGPVGLPPPRSADVAPVPLAVVLL